MQGGFTSSESSTGLQILSYYLIFFPSLDVMSAFPLTIHCIVNNIYIILTGRDTSEVPRWKLDWLFRFILRFVAALVPLLAALGIANLIYVLKYAGLVGFTIALFFPAVLQLRSIYVCNIEFSDKNKETEDTPIESDENKITEGTSLITKKSMISLSCVVEFCRMNRESYMTPYSRGYLSHPMIVLVIVGIGFCLFILAVTSLGVGPQKLTCSFY